MNALFRVVAVGKHAVDVSAGRQNRYCPVRGS